MFKDYTDVPGWGNATEIFSSIIPSLPNDARLLEIGCGLGKSTWSILDHMTPDMSLSVLDSFDYNNDRQYVWNELIRCEILDRFSPERQQDLKDLITTNSQYDIFMHVVQHHENFKLIKNIYKMQSQTYVDLQLCNHYDFIFIDGDHSYETVLNELNYFKDSTIITGDDYANPDCPGVLAAVDQFAVLTKKNLLVVNNDFVLNRSNG